MTIGLLAENSADFTNIAIYVAAGLCALLFLIGFIRRFSRMSWGGLQSLAVFAITLLLPFLAKEEGTAAFVWATVLTVGGSFLVVFAGGALRKFFRRKKPRSGFFVRFLDRLFGGLTEIVNVIVPLLALAGIAFVTMQVFGTEDVNRAAFFELSPELLNLLETPVIRDYLMPYALDLLLACFFTAFVRGGYQLGLARGLWAIVAVALTFGTVIASLLLVLRVGFVRGMAVGIAGWFSSLNPVIATLLGFGIAFLICVVVILAVVIVIHVLINMLVKKIDRVRPLRFFDGAIMAIVFCAIALVCVVGLNVGVNAAITALTGYELPPELTEAIPQEAIEGLREAFVSLARVFSSSPVAKIFYTCNPFHSVIGGGA